MLTLNFRRAPPPEARPTVKRNHDTSATRQERNHRKSATTARAQPPQGAQPPQERNHRNAGRPGARPPAVNDASPRSAPSADRGLRRPWARQVSNLRPPACKAGALPLSYAPGTVTTAGVASLPVHTSSGAVGSAATGIRAGLKGPASTPSGLAGRGGPVLRRSGWCRPGR
jgi:hypothetical protein